MNFRKLLYTLLALMLMAGACSSDDAETPTESDAAPTTAAPEATEAPVVTEAPVATEAPAPSSACQGASLTYLGLDGEAGEVELEAWRSERDATLDTTWPGGWPEFNAAILIGQEYDLGTIAYHQAQSQIAAGLWLPIDTSRLSNWDQVIPGLRESASLRDSDGAVYGAPIAWGDGPYIYSPERVDNPPTSILELLEPEWEGRFTMFDSPVLAFAYIAIANGFADASVPLTEITLAELDVVKEQAAQMLANAASFSTGYQEAADTLAAGDADLHLDGWEAMLAWGEEQGATLSFGFLDESGGGGWWDGLGIPATATNIDCAHEYIDQMLARDTQVQVAQNLFSGTVNIESIPLLSDDLPDYPYDLLQSDNPEIAFVDPSPPLEAADGMATSQDWLDAWEELKADL